MYDFNLQRDSAKHLIKTYGTTSLRVAKLGEDAKLNRKLSEEYPFLQSEVLFGIRYEMAQKPNDIVCRRVPVSFLDTETTKNEILPKVVDIFAQEFKWDNDRK